MPDFYCSTCHYMHNQFYWIINGTVPWDLSQLFPSRFKEKSFKTLNHILGKATIFVMPIWNLFFKLWVIRWYLGSLFDFKDYGTKSSCNCIVRSTAIIIQNKNSRNISSKINSLLDTPTWRTFGIPKKRKKQQFTPSYGRRWRGPS